LEQAEDSQMKIEIRKLHGPLVVTVENPYLTREMVIRFAISEAENDRLEAVSRGITLPEWRGAVRVHFGPDDKVRVFSDGEHFPELTKAHLAYLTATIEKVLVPEGFVRVV
jgi:hypothetical protein